MKRPRPLFLEERVALARRALNERTLRFCELLEGKPGDDFRQLVNDILTVLDGDPSGRARKALRGAK